MCILKPQNYNCGHRFFKRSLCGHREICLEGKDIYFQVCHDEQDTTTEDTCQGCKAQAEREAEKAAERRRRIRVLRNASHEVQWIISDMRQEAVEAAHGLDHGLQWRIWQQHIRELEAASGMLHGICVARYGYGWRPAAADRAALAWSGVKFHADGSIGHRNGRYRFLKNMGYDDLVEFFGFCLGLDFAVDDDEDDDEDQHDGDDAGEEEIGTIAGATAMIAVMNL